MALIKQEPLGELKHAINNSLAAIRNALYLAAVQTSDPEMERYLKLADVEVSRIAAILNNASQIDENKMVNALTTHVNSASAA